MPERKEHPYARALRLAAYVESRTSGCNRKEIATDVPGYGDLGNVALAKLLDRDRRSLRDNLGIDIRWDDGAQQYWLDRPFFSTEERAALIAAAALVNVDGIDRGSPADDLGSAVAEDAARVVVLVHDLVVAMRDGIATSTPVRFGYRGQERTVAPYCVGMWRNRWYMVGRQLSPETDGDARRKYRLDRIAAADDGPAVVPAPDAGRHVIPVGFDAVGALQLDPNSWGADPPVVARIAIPRDQLPLLLTEFGATVVGDTGDEVTLDVEVRDYESFVLRLLGFGPTARLLGPNVLVERRRAWLAPQVVA